MTQQQSRTLITGKQPGIPLSWHYCSHELQQGLFIFSLPTYFLCLLSIYDPKLTLVKAGKQDFYFA